jgi:hypothetical protein
MEIGSILVVNDVRYLLKYESQKLTLLISIWGYSFYFNSKRGPTNKGQARLKLSKHHAEDKIHALMS